MARCGQQSGSNQQRPAQRAAPAPGALRLTAAAHTSLITFPIPLGIDRLARAILHDPWKNVAVAGRFRRRAAGV
jgi:hypothetical protein